MPRAPRYAVGRALEMWLDDHPADPVLAAVSRHLASRIDRLADKDSAAAGLATARCVRELRAVWDRMRGVS